MTDNLLQFTVQLDGQESHHVVDIEGIYAISSGVTIHANPTDQVGVYHIDLGGTIVPAYIESDGIDKVKVSLRGYVFTGRVLRSRHHELLSILNASDGMKTRTVRVLAPMPGLLKAVHITDGMEDRKHQQLFTLEAMKMENSISSPIHGIVRELTIAMGQAVEKGFKLCTIEPTQP